MALDFPNTPTNGQVYVYNGTSYYFDSANNCWITSYTPGASIITSVNGTAGEIYSSGGLTPTLNLIATGVVANTYGGTGVLPVFTVDTKGRLTAAANLAFAPMDYVFANTKVAAVVSNSTSRLWANTIIDASNNENVYIDLATTGVTARTYGGANQIPVITVDAYGRITSSANTTAATGSPSLTTDTSSSSSLYPIFTTQSSGNLTATSVHTTGLTFVPSTGTLSATIFNSLSDSRFKINIQNIEDSTSILESIRPVSFNWKQNGNKSYGVIAQELEEFLPELVVTNENDMKTVSYDPLIAILIDVVKKQQKEIDEIKKMLNDKSL